MMDGGRETHSSWTEHRGNNDILKKGYFKCSWSGKHHNFLHGKSFSVSTSMEEISLSERGMTDKIYNE